MTTQMQRITARRLAGKLVRIACTNGSSLSGRLIGVTGRSIWVVSQGEDHFVDVTDVIELGPATAA